MSLVVIRAALEGHLAAMSPALATAWENMDFDPPEPATPEDAPPPYQVVTLQLARPENLESGSLHTQRGALHVSLRYPLDAGPGVAMERAELIRATFYRGLSLPVVGGTLTIDRTVGIATGQVDGDRFALPVSIPFFADVQS